MKIIELDHYNLRAPRELLERLRLFYTETVGLSVGYRPRFQKFGYWLYAGDHAVLHLSESSQDNVMPTDQTSFNHAAFNCSGLEEFQQRLSKLGVEYSTARVPELKRVQLFFSDPAGNGVELSFPDD
ncbi:MAG: VOC family protein [Gammaproteobacteria bacterium]|nr:VOC family protein [Gammaproteobacteria bacterium]NNC57216.1 diguanylate cyclase [Woeseiaceae bacterium]NNL50433.1 diguanylate cyclase [Woeseiaceae bacterium]